MVDLKSVFEGAQAYVMLSRMKEIDQLHILDELPENKIYPIKKAQDEINKTNLSNQQHRGQVTLHSRIYINFIEFM